MRIPQNFMFAALMGVMAAGIAFWAQAGTNEDSALDAPVEVSQADAIFAGGCFWCVEADFDKVEGVLDTISGYTGGRIDNPTYKQVSKEDTGHYEAVRVIYDPSIVTYEELVSYFWRHVDPTDADGQFCDRGESYRTAIFVDTEEEREIAASQKAAIDAAGYLPGPIVTPILDEATFWPAETYHQNYYKKNPARYLFYRTTCGRDGRIEKVWQDAPETGAE